MVFGFLGSFEVLLGIFGDEEDSFKFNVFRKFLVFIYLVVGVQSK